MYSYQNNLSNPNNKNSIFKNKIKPSKIEIEYEKISQKINSEFIPVDENDNFNVYFMKPDLKYKTISTSNSLTSTKIKKLNQRKEKNKEKEFKSHLIQKLKSLKLGQNNKDKIQLNMASKIRREESMRNSLKYLLEKQSQYDPKKELMYYKAYFRFWKRKCKNNGDKLNKKIIKKDKNIRITTVIYKADKPHKNYSNNIIEERKDERNGRKKDFFRNKLIRIVESKSKDKNIINSNKENKEIKNKENEVIKEKNRNKTNKININIQSNLNNIKTIKNIITNEVNIIPKENEMNQIYPKKKIYEINNDKKEALNKINIDIKKGFKLEGFKELKKFRNKSREKEGTEKLNDIFLKRNKQYKEEAINKIKQNNYLKDDDDFDIEGEKWTVNKLNWQIEELYKDKDSLYGLSDEDLKESKNQNLININTNEQQYGNNLIPQNQINSNEIPNDYNINNNIDNQLVVSKNKENNNQALNEENQEENEEEIEYEMISNEGVDNMEDIENNDNNVNNEEEYINYEEMENNNIENGEEYNYEEGDEEYNYEEDIGEEYMGENEMEEEMLEENENFDENGLNYLNEEAEEMMNENEQEENDEENKDNH